MDGKLRLERRNASPMIYARAYLQGKNRQYKTGEIKILAAATVATEWYLDLRQRIGRNEKLDTPLFSEFAEMFIAAEEKAERVSVGQREQYRIKWEVLKPYFEGVKVAEVDTAFLEALRETRSHSITVLDTNIKPATLKKDLLFCVMVLRHAKQKNHLDKLPDVPSFSGNGKFAIRASPRPFLDEDQYKKLHRLAKQRANEPNLNPRVRRQRVELYCLILMCVGAALRVGEAHSIRWCDCELVKLKLPDGSQEDAVHMMVLGKHSKGGQREDAYGLYGAVHGYNKLLAERPERLQTDLLFSETHREGMKQLLTSANLRLDPKTGKTRDAKSLRSTGISMRLDKGDNVSYREAAIWARTSVTMIEKFYDQTHPQRIAERVAGFRKPIKQVTRSRPAR